MFKWFQKKVEYLPVPDPAVTLEGVQLWYVEWQGRKGDYWTDLQTNYEAFPSHGDAKAFAESLKAAFKLLRINSTSGSTEIKVYTK